MGLFFWRMLTRCCSGQHTNPPLGQRGDSKQEMRPSASDWSGRMNESEAAAPTVATEEDEEQARRRRKERILASREDRLAKIMSMASGRTVDPKEIHIDRTPSPSVSERAAAGIGRLEDPADDSTASLNQQASTSSLAREAGAAPHKRGAANDATFHLVVVLLAAILFYVWHLAVQGRFGTPPLVSYLEAFSPSQLLLGSFLTVEAIEFAAGRVSVTGMIGDFALYLWLILVLIKIY